MEGKCRKILLRSLNQQISCKICKGYLVDATTVTECLHTFCKSCLVKHLEKLSTCPTCEIVIHQSHPLNFISYDRTMQDIVNYLCPKLQEEEARREEEFYRKKKIPNPRANMIPNGNGVNHENHIVLSNNSTANSLTNGNTFPDNTLHHSNRHHPYNSTHRVKTEEEKYSKDINSYHRGDDQLNIVIESYPGCKLDPVKRKYIRCSIHTTITHIRKFVAKKLYKNFEQYKEVDILCNGRLVGKDHSLKFVHVTHWMGKEPPLRLQYRERQEP